MQHNGLLNLNIMGAPPNTIYGVFNFQMLNKLSQETIKGSLKPYFRYIEKYIYFERSEPFTLFKKPTRIKTEER